MGNLTRINLGPHLSIWHLTALLTGTIPWSGCSQNDQLKNAIVGHWVDNSKLLQSAKIIVKRCFVTDRQYRADAKELENLFGVLEDVYGERKSLLRKLSDLLIKLWLNYRLKKCDVSRRWSPSISSVKVI